MVRRKRRRRRSRRTRSKQPYKRNEVLQQRFQHRTSLAGPARLRPNALARLQQRACAPLLRAGLRGRLQQCACAQQQRACARLLRATKATGLRARLGGTQSAARIFVDCDGGCNAGIKMVAWPRVGFARARLSMVLGFQHGQQQCQQVLTQPTKHKVLHTLSTFCHFCHTCCAVAEGPLGRLQERACVRSLRATKATGLRACLGRTQGGTRFGGLRRVQGVSKMVAWPRAGLLCKEGQAEHGVGISAWSAAASVSFDSTY